MDERRVDDILRVITRIPVPRGQIALYKAFVEASDGWITADDVARHIYPDKPESFGRMLAALSKRVNATALETVRARVGGLVVYEQRGSEYRARPELLAAVERSPELSEWVGRPWSDVVALSEGVVCTAEGIVGRQRRRDQTSQRHAFWSYLDHQAELLERPWSLRLRWAQQAASDATAILRGTPDGARVFLGERVQARLDDIDADAVTERLGADGRGWRDKFDEVVAEPGDPLSLNAAGRLVFGPLFHADRSSHSYNAWQHFEVDPEDVATWFADARPGPGWVTLDALRAAVTLEVVEDEHEAASTPTEFDLDLNRILDIVDAAPEVERFVRHNVGQVRLAWGCRALLEDDVRHFDFVEDYWYRPERRVVVAYLARRWDRAFAPAESMRQVAWSLVEHFDRGRDDGVFAGWRGADYAVMGGWTLVCDRLREHAERLPDSEGFQQLRRCWRVSALTLRDHSSSSWMSCATTRSGPRRTRLRSGSGPLGFRSSLQPLATRCRAGRRSSSTTSACSPVRTRTAWRARSPSRGSSRTLAPTPS